MPKSHPDPFAALEPARPKLEPHIIDGVRAHLHQRLALVKAAEATPWTDMLTIIKEDNDVRSQKGLLPPEEGEALWAAFDVEMDRLYAIMNKGLDLDELQGIRHQAAAARLSLSPALATPVAMPRDGCAFPVGPVPG